MAVMMCAWVLPDRLWCQTDKAYYLQFVDAYGKYSLVDFYVMTLMLCAFHFDMQLAGDDLEVLLYVVPNWGFLAFLLATLISLGLGHISVAFLRFSHEPDDSRVILGAGRGDTEYLAEHAFELRKDTADRLRLGEVGDSGDIYDVARQTQSHRGSGVGDSGDIASTQRGSNSHDGQNMQYVMTVTQRGCMCILGCHLLLVCMIVYGSYANSFAFSFQGLTGWLLGDDASVEYVTGDVSLSIHFCLLYPSLFFCVEMA